MSFQAPLLRPPHFTYSTSPVHLQSASTSAVRPSYNEMSVADRVVRACAWTDKSADFVFGDGTVLSFCDEMQTFVAFSPSKTALSKPQGFELMNNNFHANKNGNMDEDDDNNQGDYFFTPLTLSKYENKVREALHIYNFYSPYPRIIAGLTATPCEVWRQHSPIDSLIIAADARFFERHGSRATLWCALRRISLTLHGGRMTFSVRWPVRAVERNMSRSIFVCPVDDHGHISGTLESVRAFHYTWVEQTFPVLEPPDEWVDMLKTALQLDVEIPLGNGTVISDDETRSERKHSHEDCSMLYRTTPRTALNKQPCSFSKMRREHIYALIATAQMQNATCNRYIRDSSERVAWRYDADPMGRIPHAIYWGLKAQNATEVVKHLSAPGHFNMSGLYAERPISDCAFGCVLAMVREDESTVVAEPKGQSYTIHHWRREGTYHQYHQSADGELGLPPVIPQLQEEGRGGRNVDGDCEAVSCNNDKLSSSMLIAGEDADCVISSKRVSLPFYFNGLLEEAPLYALYRGRYLSEVGASCIQISQLNLASLRAQRQERLDRISDIVAGVHVDSTSINTAGGPLVDGNVEVENLASVLLDRTRMRMISNDPALAAAAAEGNVVYMTSSIDNVGTFSALTNGTVRCHFDDRTILFLIPGVDDREENLVATCLFRDATQCSMRLVKCLPHHRMYRYVAYALQFRRFARLSPDGRKDVINDTATLKLQLLGETEWRRENEAEVELQKLISRTQDLLLGNDELRQVNKSLLYGEEGNSSTYFS